MIRIPVSGLVVCALLVLTAGCSRSNVPSPELVKDLASDSARARAGARAILVERRGEAVPALVAFLETDDLVARIAAAETLGEIGFEAVPALREAAKKTSAPSAPWAIFALGRIGPDAHEAVPVLREAMTHRHLEQVAREALNRIEK